jgi:hypothetical protein
MSISPSEREWRRTIRLRPRRRQHGTVHAYDEDIGEAAGQPGKSHPRYDPSGRAVVGDRSGKGSFCAGVLNGN